MPANRNNNSKSNSKSKLNIKGKANTKSKKKRSNNRNFSIAKFISQNRVVITAALVIVAVFLLLAVFKKDRDMDKLTYDGLPEEEESKSYALSELNDDYYFVDEYYFRSYDDGKITSKRGIDVSEHQGEIDWAEVKAAGVEFAYIRAGYRTYDMGNLKEDAYFRYNMDNAIANGIDVGVYFFSQAITVDESIEEAKYTVDLVADYDIDLPIAHDMEDIHETGSRIDDLSMDERTEIADAFCSVIENYGYNSIIYGNPSWIMTKLNLFRLTERKIWLANYTDKTMYPFRFEIWQYSESGNVDGIETPVDLDIMFIRNE